MFEMTAIDHGDKAAAYRALEAQAVALMAGERDPVANAANLAALIFHQIPGLNWAGFYFLKGDQLVVGPFQGRPACVRIALGRGVCGAAAVRKETIVVDDVEQFPGHIPCDAESRSEIVVPLIRPAGDFVGVLDLDSPYPSRFDSGDAAGLEALAARYIDSLGS